MSTARFHLQHPRRLLAVGILVLVAAALVAAATLPRDEERTSTTTTVERPTPTVGEDEDVRPRIGDESIPQDAPDGARSGAGGAQVESAMAQAPEDTTTTDEPISPDREAAPAIEPKLVRTATISMRVDDGKFEQVWDGIRGVGDGARITVVDASRSDRGDSGSLGTMTLRVPSARLDEIVDELRDVGNVKVERLDVSSDDVSGEYVDTQSRLRHDRAVERRLVTLLADTKDVGEVLAVQARLDGVQEQIEVSAGRIAYLDASTSTSTITISLRERSASTTADAEDEPSALGEAWEDARERFTGNIAGAIVWTGGALPVLVLLVLAAVAGRIAWGRVTRRRTAAPTVDPS